MRKHTLSIALLTSILLIVAGCGDGPPDADGTDTARVNGAAETTADTLGGGPAAANECTMVEQGFGPAGDEEITAEEVVSGLEVPWGLAFLPDGDMLVTERPGRIRLVENGTLVEEPIAQVQATAGGEGGLLGIAPHPNFESNRYFFIYYTSDGGSANQVERWQLSEDGRSATVDEVVLGDIPGARFHNGGRLRIGPDNMLYIGTGDAGNADLAQDPNSLAGKLLRITPDGGVPDDNPTTNSLVYLSGIRNTQGFDWPDGQTIWLADHGPTGEMGLQGFDEVNVASPGENLGWPRIHGCREQEDMVTPVLSWRTAVPPGGAAIYRGDAISEWNGDLIVGTLGSEHLHRVSIGPGGAVEQHGVYLLGNQPEGYGRLREVITGPDNEMYVTTSNCDGRGSCPADGDKILRIMY